MKISHALQNGAHGFSLLLLSVSAYQNVGNAFGSLCLVFFYDMGIEVFGGVDACMEEQKNHKGEEPAEGVEALIADAQRRSQNEY